MAASRPLLSPLPTSRRRSVIDVLFVLLTVGLFAAMALLVRAVERL
ncbi:hypothetical protein AB0J86_33150 [Micromonospora sp. NPDC049559]